MPAFNDGRFSYLDDKHRLFFENPSMNGTFALTYGGVVTDYAINESLKMIALLCPADTASSGHQQSSVNDEKMSIIRLYNMEHHEMTRLVDELMVVEATQVMWLENRFLIASKPDGITSIAKYNKEKLTMFVQDEGVFPFVGLQWLGLVSLASQSVDFWDLVKNKKVETHPLVKKKKSTRTVSGSCSDGNYVFVMNTDLTMYSFYVTKGSIRPLSPIISVLSPSRPPAAHIAAAGTPLCAALSSAQVLVSAEGGRDIVRMKYVKKEATFVTLEKITLKEGEQIVDISKERVLFTRSENGKTVYCTEAIQLSNVASNSNRNNNNNSNNNRNNNNNNNSINNNHHVEEEEAQESVSSAANAKKGKSAVTAAAASSDKKKKVVSHTPNKASNSSKNSLPVGGLIAGGAAAVIVAAVVLKWMRK